MSGAVRLGRHELAQMNVAQMRGPLDAGFVWRLQDEGGDATSIRAFDDPLLLVNMSVWESVEALRGVHARARVPAAGLSRRRTRWSFADARR